MHPTLALFFTLLFVVFLFWRDVKERPPISGALWIPLLWMLILGSRGISEWLGWAGETYGTSSELEAGTPLDAAVYFSFELAALLILLRRRLSWASALSNNSWTAIFLGYCAFAILWSDYPFVALKRWIKVLAMPLMVLVVATEPDPQEAVVRLLKRTAYVLIPFSILLIKYYPALGSSFSQWTGAVYYNGVASNKNLLGCLCFIFGLFFVWHLLTILRREKTPERRNGLILCAAFLAMIAWLLSKADSATSVMALAVGTATVLFLGLQILDKKHVGAYLTTALLALGIAEVMFGISGALIRALGRDSTLTGRTEIWDAVLSVGSNPILGAGFESFWLGERVEQVWARFSYTLKINQAHNGYLETYLNLGWIGVILLVGWILAAFQMLSTNFQVDFDFGRFRLGLLAAAVAYNYTEAAFTGLSLVWFACYLVALEFPQALKHIENSHTLRITSRRRLVRPSPIPSRQLALRRSEFVISDEIRDPFVPHGATQSGEHNISAASPIEHLDPQGGDEYELQRILEYKRLRKVRSSRWPIVTALIGVILVLLVCVSTVKSLMSRPRPWAAPSGDRTNPSSIAPPARQVGESPSPKAEVPALMPASKVAEPPAPEAISGKAPPRSSPQADGTHPTTAIRPTTPAAAVPPASAPLSRPDHEFVPGF